MRKFEIFPIEVAQFVKEGTRVVVQENVAQTLLAQNAIDSKDASAIIRFDHDRTIHLGGIEAQALYFGNAYSVGNTVVYFPNVKVVAVGQLFSSNPKLELADGGSLVRWSSVLGDVLKLDFDTAVPASGPPITKPELQAFKCKLDILVGWSFRRAADEQVEDRRPRPASNQRREPWNGRARSSKRFV